MADPRWKNLRDVQSDVVQLLSSLLSGPLLDKLQTKDLLTDDNYESVRRKKKNDGDIEAARDLITLLKKTPTPAYESFCEALREVDGGETVLRKLQGPGKSSMLSECYIRRPHLFPALKHEKLSATAVTVPPASV